MSNKLVLYERSSFSDIFIFCPQKLIFLSILLGYLKELQSMTSIFKITHKAVTNIQVRCISFLRFFSY